MKTVFALFIGLSMVVFAQAQKDSKSLPKLSPDEIIAKHIASIGSPSAVSAVKSRVFVGQAQLTSKIGYIGQLMGQAQFASSGDSIILATVFNSNDYPYEKAAFDGKDVSVGRPNGSLTPFGEFIKSNKGIVREGLFGGVLSTAWPLLDQKNKLKFESAGTAEIGGRQFYKLKVSGGGLSDLKVVLFFDAENFHHMATEYTQIKSVGISARSNPKPENDEFGTATTTGMANTKQTYMTLTERFSNFVKSGGIVIPMTYVIDYTYQDSNRGSSLDLDIRFQNVYLNQDIAQDAFKVS
jgi:hypothetical protein